MSLIASIIWLIVSLALILIGANALTDGSSAIAKRMGISDLIIGLTVVAFGTSTPELVISIVAAADGNPSIAVGNIVGSNILNILLIIGLTALVRPIFIKKSIMTNEIPMLILSSVILLVLGYSAALDGIATPTVTRVNGIFLLIFFLLFMRYTFASAKSAPQSGEKDPAEADGQRLGKFSTVKSAAFVIGGLAALIWGGDKFVDSASTLARHIGMSEATIGLTIVAIGTSLPELATSIVAAVKGQSALAVGNVIGSNIFNVLLILGTASVVAPLPFAGVSLVDLWTLVGASVLFLVFGWFFRTRCITRAEGAVMLACYLAYTAWLLIK
ncbi:MAG: calcium/sodium antiporter [Muribaculaceae bacterium]|nr:calcium/sodium antiporter [Muribaculaceae bacterium]